MDPSQVQEGEAIRMCQFLDRPITADNLVTVSSFLAQHGGTAQHAVEDPLCDWSTWKDFLEVGGDDAVQYERLEPVMHKPAAIIVVVGAVCSLPCFVMRHLLICC